MTDSASLASTAGVRALVRPGWWVSVVVTASARGLLNLVQQPGLITFDTKLDLQFDAGDFLSPEPRRLERRLDARRSAEPGVGLSGADGSGVLARRPLGHVPDVDLGTAVDGRVMLLAYFGAVAAGAQLARHRCRGARCWPGSRTCWRPRVLTTVGGLSGETLPVGDPALDGAAPGALPARSAARAGSRSCGRPPPSRGWAVRTPTAGGRLPDLPGAAAPARRRGRTWRTSVCGRGRLERRRPGGQPLVDRAARC